jgi:hypothetical protein
MSGFSLPSVLLQSNSPTYYAKSYVPREKFFTIRLDIGERLDFGLLVFGTLFRHRWR